MLGSFSCAASRLNASKLFGDMECSAKLRWCSNSYEDALAFIEAGEHVSGLLLV